MSRRIHLPYLLSSLLSYMAYAISIDCPDLINLALGLNMDIKRPTTMAEVLNDCCSATGVACVSQRVRVIQWGNINLDGVINGTALPSSLQELDLDGNRIVGNLPRIWPSGITDIYVDGNKLTGDVPTFPSSLKYLYLGSSGSPGNRFTGQVKLNRPSEVRLNYNWITDVIISDTSQLTVACDISYNPLLGNPNIDNIIGAPVNCLHAGLYSASLLPYTVTVASTQISEIKTSIPLLTKVIFTSNSFMLGSLKESTTQKTYSISTSMIKPNSVVSIILSTKISAIIFISRSTPVSSIITKFNQQR